MCTRSLASSLAALLFLGGCTDATSPRFPAEPRADDTEVASLRLDRAALSAALGDTVRLHPRARDRRGRPAAAANVRWRVSDPTIAVVEDGLVIPLRPGEVEVTASTSTAQASTRVNVWGDARVTRIAVMPDPLELAAATTAPVALLVSYSNGTLVQLRTSATWKSVDTRIATVRSGVVRGVAAGSTRLVASLAGLVDTGHVTVTPAAVVLPPAPPGPAALPQVTVNTDLPAVTGRTIHVRAGDNLQTAINAAALGDEIVLEAGATFTGRFTLKDKGPGTRWITIRSSASDRLPPPGTRVTPADSIHMARIVSKYASDAVINTEPGAHHYRLIGLNVTAPAERTSTGTLVALGSTSRANQGLYEQQPHHIILDRIYVHGHATLSFQRCIALNTAEAAVIDSWISDCHGRGMDSQAIASWTGTGPYLIHNNHLAGAGENVMFGGSDMKIPGALPSDITITRNHFYKPPAWKGRWTVKNLFELKFGQRILVEGNVFENNWSDAQTGFALLFKSVNQEGGMPWAQTADVTVRHNVIRNSPNGVSLHGRPGSTGVVMARITFHNNVMERLGQQSDWPRNGQPFQIARTHGLSITNNTAIGEYQALYLHHSSPTTGLVVQRNIFGTGNSVIASADGKGSGTKALDAHAPGWVVEDNVLVGARSDWYPAGNLYPRTLAELGFRSFESGDLHVSAGSPHAGYGADLDEIRTATQGATAGMQR